MYKYLNTKGVEQGNNLLHMNIIENLWEQIINKQ